jgi:hypothetical protein
MRTAEQLRKYGLIGAGGLIVVWALICYLVFAAPKTRELERVAKQDAATSKQLGEMKQKIADYEAIYKEIQIGKSRFERFGILSADEEPVFLADLVQYFRETNNSLIQVMRAPLPQPVETPPPGPETPAGQGPGAPAGAGPTAPPPPRMYRLPLTINFSGTFGSSFNLLRRLENYTRLITVERMDLATDQRDGYPKMNGNISVDLYLAELPETPAASAGSSASATPPSL